MANTSQQHVILVSIGAVDRDEQSLLAIQLNHCYGISLGYAFTVGIQRPLATNLVQCDASHQA